MKIVVFTGSYYPNYSAVGVCAKNIVDELFNSDLKILQNNFKINKEKNKNFSHLNINQEANIYDNSVNKYLINDNLNIIYHLLSKIIIT